MACWTCEDYLLGNCTLEEPLCKQCPDCNYVYMGESCPKCDEYMDFDPQWLVVPEGKVAAEMLAWEEYYRRT